MASVDLSLVPVSYGVYLDGSDHLRETESPRLRAREDNQLPPAKGNISSTNTALQDEQLNQQVSQRGVKDIEAPVKSITNKNSPFSTHAATAKNDTADVSNNEGMDWSATRR